MPITGPYTLANWSFNEAYEDDDELTLAVADLVNEEIEKLVEAGARYIQIDEPALATTPDDHAIVGEALEHIVADIPRRSASVSTSVTATTPVSILKSWTSRRRVRLRARKRRLRPARRLQRP